MFTAFFTTETPPNLVNNRLLYRLMARFILQETQKNLMSKTFAFRRLKPYALGIDETLFLYAYSLLSRQLEL